jgi:hypothetical protein
LPVNKQTKKIKTTMKKLIFAFIAICMTSQVFAQDKFTSYFQKYNDKDYSIQLSKSGESYKLWIDAMSLDAQNNSGGIMLDEKQHAKFIETLSNARDKYAEWDSVALKNNVTEANKTMEIVGRTSAYFSYGDWQFDYSVSLEFNFRIIQAGNVTKRLLVIKTGELKSSTNQFMEVDGYAIVFSSPSEMGTFIDSISQEKVRAFMAKPKTEEIFK